jgi:DNA-nicking Smr family endonuclease
MSGHDRKPLRRKLSEEERTLWGRFTRSVAPLRRRPVPAEPSKVASAPPVTHAKPAARTPAAQRGAMLVPNPVLRLEPLDRRQKQRLARGTEVLQARIDLHGRTQAEAHVALLRFLRKAQSDGAKFVLVITGKGFRGRAEGDGRGVLKRQVPQWLKLPEFRPYVLAFEDAHIGHGGEGALYVRVRRAR